MELLASLLIFILILWGFAYVVFRIMESFGTTNDEAQQGYALRLRRENGFREFRIEFASMEIPNAVLRAAFDLLWLDVLWAREGPVNRDTRLDRLYEDGRRFDDVVRTLAKLCRVDGTALDSGWDNPITVGELVILVADLKNRENNDNANRLLRPAAIDGPLLRPAVGRQQPEESLLRAVETTSEPFESELPETA